MKPYFQDDAIWRKSKEAILGWIGTPHRHRWHKKGRGADCALFVAEVLVELGALSELALPEYPPDWFMHSAQEIIKDAFAKHSSSFVSPGFHLVLLDEKEESLLRGDLLGFRGVSSRVETSHVGIYLPEEKAFIHCLKPSGVSLMNWDESWRSKLTLLYRVMVD